MKVILPFILNGQTLEKGMNFPKSVVSGSKDTLVVKVEGIPEGQNAVAYFSLSWENGKTYNLLFNGDECVIDEYITTLPKTTNDFIEYYVTMSVAVFGDAGKRLTTKPVKLVLHKSNYSATADNTPEIPQSQFDAIVEIFNEKVAELSGGDIYLSKDEANYQLLKGYIDTGKTVIIKDDSSYLYLSAFDDDYVSFYSVTGGNYGYIDYYSDGNVEEYWSPAFVNTEDVQHDYDANSDKPISGQGVAEALETVGGGEKAWELVEEITLTDETNPIYFDTDKLRQYKELHIEGLIVPTDTTVTNQVIQFNDGSPLFQANVNCKSTGKIYIVMDIYQSPRKSTIFDGTISAYDYTLSGATMKVTKMESGLPQLNTDGLYIKDYFNFRLNGTNTMAVDTCVKVWGR